MIKHIQDINLQGKCVILRVDFNTPMRDDQISDETRILQSIPTIKHILNHAQKLIIISHLGRPDPKKSDNSHLSLRLICARLQELLHEEVAFVTDITSLSQRNDKITMLENLRFFNGEKKNDVSFAKYLSYAADIYINDAFSCVHRSHASVDALPRMMESYAGFSLMHDIENLQKISLDDNTNALVIVGGSKISTKIELIKHLSRNARNIFIGGAMANNFLVHQGFNVGNSLVEKNCDAIIEEILRTAENNNCNLILPIDCIVSQNINDPNYAKVDVNNIPHDKMILDIGPKTIEKLGEIIKDVDQVIWNGPLGVFENEPFDRGTIKIAETIAEQTALGKIKSFAGGGDSIAAIKKAKVEDQFTYISTAGGAFLEYLSGKELPGLDALGFYG